MIRNNWIKPRFKTSYLQSPVTNLTVYVQCGVAMLRMMVGFSEKPGFSDVGQSGLPKVTAVIVDLAIFSVIDDYAKDGGPGEVRLLCSFYHEPLRSWIEKDVNKFAISNHTALTLDVQALRRYLSLICEYELYILPNKKVSTAKDHGKNYMKDRPLLVRHL